ncbi:MAG TPA: tetratricopeptide repeat protein, partial [Leucothrix sp.]|nr:tetratricopeptide repeat protein [Leucothrix sp.]
TDGHTVSVLAVGTEKGGFLRLRTKRVNVKLDTETLQKISKKGGGGYHTITANNTDLNTVLKIAVTNDKKNQEKTEDFKSDDWKSSGPYLLLLLLPIAALAFRKGWLLNLFIAIGLTAVFIQPHAVYADSTENTVDKNSTEETAEKAQSFGDSVSKQWRKLWFNNEQRADRAFKQKQYQQASQLSEAPLRKGSASYKSNDYKAALDAFQKAQGADARYNQGNTLAKLEKYKEAIESYKKALEVNPDMEDAKINKKAIEDFLKKKKQQEKQQQNQKDEKKKGDKNKKQKGKKSGKKGEGKDDAQENKEGDKQGDKESNEKNQFAKANKDLEKKKNANKQKQADEEKEAQDKASKAKKAGQDKNDEQAQDENKAKAIKAAKEKAEELSKEEKMAAEQWLRRIPDDPGGLLRRKFRRQYQRNNRRPNDDEQPW